jgi:hypothetical protein
MKNQILNVYQFSKILLLHHLERDPIAVIQKAGFTDIVFLDYLFIAHLLGRQMYDENCSFAFLALKSYCAA